MKYIIFLLLILGSCKKEAETPTRIMIVNSGPISVHLGIPDADDSSLERDLQSGDTAYYPAGDLSLYVSGMVQPKEWPAVRLDLYEGGLKQVYQNKTDNFWIDYRKR